MNNSVFTIHPFKKDGMWVFNDEARNLVEEPFVFGSDIIINRLLNDEQCQRCRFIFSSQELPEYDTVLEKVGQGSKVINIGTYYRCKKTQLMGWLCPALNLYYKESPEKIYVKIEKIYEENPI
jgi:hypothetical protein